MVTRRRPQDRAAQYADSVYRELVERLSVNVRRIREEQDTTQEDAAVACDMDVRMLQLVENQGTNPTFTTLARLARGFGVDASELLAPRGERGKKSARRPGARRPARS